MLGYVQIITLYVLKNCVFSIKIEAGKTPSSVTLGGVWLQAVLDTSGFWKMKSLTPRSVIACAESDSPECWLILDFRKNFEIILKIQPTYWL